MLLLRIYCQPLCILHGAQQQQLGYPRPGSCPPSSARRTRRWWRRRVCASRACQRTRRPAGTTGDPGWERLGRRHCRREPRWSLVRGKGAQFGIFHVCWDIPWWFEIFQIFLVTPDRPRDISSQILFSKSGPFLTLRTTYHKSWYRLSVIRGMRSHCSFPSQTWYDVGFIGTSPKL